MGFCEPARQDYSPPPPGAGGASSNGANGGGYAPPPPPPISGAQGGNADGNGGRGGDEGVDPEVEKHEYDPEACKVLLWIGIYLAICAKGKMQGARGKLMHSSVSKGHLSARIETPSSFGKVCVFYPNS